MQPVLSTGVMGQPTLNLTGTSYAKSKTFGRIGGPNSKRARSTIIMSAVPEGKEDYQGSSDVKSDKAPWQRGFETYVRFNGNPLEKVIPFIPKQ